MPTNCAIFKGPHRNPTPTIIYPAGPDSPPRRQPRIATIGSLHYRSWLMKHNTRPQSAVKSRVVMGEPSGLRLDSVQLEIGQGVPMPYFNFDLVIGEDFKGQGGTILEDTGIAIDKADNLASELCIVRSELRLVP